MTEIWRSTGCARGAITFLNRASLLVVTFVDAPRANSAPEEAFASAKNENGS